VGGACSTHGSCKICIQNVDGETLKARDHSENLGVHGSIILEWIIKK